MVFQRLPSNSERKCAINLGAAPCFKLLAVGKRKDLGEQVLGGSKFYEKMFKGNCLQKCMEKIARLVKQE